MGAAVKKTTWKEFTKAFNTVSLTTGGNEAIRAVFSFNPSICCGVTAEAACGFALARSAKPEFKLVASFAPRMEPKTAVPTEPPSERKNVFALTPHPYRAFQLNSAMQ